MARMKSWGCVWACVVGLWAGASWAAHSGVFLDAGEFVSLGAFDPAEMVTLTAGEEEAYLSVGGTPTYYGVLYTNAGTTNWVFAFSSFQLDSAVSLDLNESYDNRGRPVYFLSQSSMEIAGNRPGLCVPESRAGDKAPADHARGVLA